MKTNTQKCVIVSEQNTGAFIFIDKDLDENPVARLPFKNEIPPKVLQNSQIKELNNNLLLINTHEEIEPFDIFPDFTVADDYGFLSFTSKSKGFSSYSPDKPEDKIDYKYWDILNLDDKRLIEEYLF